MEDFMKMILFVFLGLIIAIMVLGYHKSPQASPALGQQQAASKTTPFTSTKTYPSNQRNY